jgi:hypothetical protein
MSFANPPFLPLPEEWRPLPDWDDLYEVSDAGRVRRLKLKFGSWFPAVYLRRGRATVLFRRKHKQFTLQVSRLVASAFLSNYSENLQVDHIDGNPGNNSVSNLRMATKAQNAKNRRINRNNSAGAKGVHFHTRDEVFIARIAVDGMRLQLGSFKTLASAQTAYDAAAIKYFGRFARSA